MSETVDAEQPTSSLIARFVNPLSRSPATCSRIAGVSCFTVLYFTQNRRKYQRYFTTSIRVSCVGALAGALGGTYRYIDRVRPDGQRRWILSICIP
jgi:hypothetical protein